MKKTQQFFYILIILIGVIFVLIYAKPLLIPFILAFIFWFVIRDTKIWLKKVSYVCRKLPTGVLTLTATSILFIALGFAVRMISSNIQTLSTQLPMYEANLDKTISELDKSLGINSKGYLAEFTRNLDLSNMIRQTLNSLSDLFNNTLMILFYTIFLLIEESVFDTKLRAIYEGNMKNYHTTSSILEKIESSMSNYITLKSLVSLCTGILSYFILLFLKIDAPFFWAFLIFLLNYIPTIGSLIATTFPALFAVFQYGEIEYFFYVIGLVGVVQTIVGNFVEPKVMGSSLNISSLVVIIALAFWGYIWGITGMILSVPITVILIILCAQFESTRAIAVLLSEKGDIDQLRLNVKND